MQNMPSTSAFWLFLLVSPAIFAMDTPDASDPGEDAIKFAELIGSPQLARGAGYAAMMEKFKPAAAHDLPNADSDLSDPEELNELYELNKVRSPLSILPNARTPSASCSPYNRPIKSSLSAASTALCTPSPAAKRMPSPSIATPLLDAQLKKYGGGQIIACKNWTPEDEVKFQNECAEERRRLIELQEMKLREKLRYDYDLAERISLRFFARDIRANYEAARAAAVRNHVARADVPTICVKGFTVAATPVPCYPAIDKWAEELVSTFTANGYSAEITLSFLHKKIDEHTDLRPEEKVYFYQKVCELVANL